MGLDLHDVTYSGSATSDIMQSCTVGQPAQLDTVTPATRPVSIGDWVFWLAPPNLHAGRPGAVDLRVPRPGGHLRGGTSQHHAARSARTGP
jgi:hypothetical protein